MPLTARRRSGALVAAVVAATSLAFTTTTEDAPAVAEETLFIAAGCPSDTPGTCTSTRWLGLGPGDATSNYLTATLPVDEVLYRAEGSINWRDYPARRDVPDYELSGDAVVAVVRLESSGPGVQTTVRARLTGRVDGKTTTFTVEPQVVNLLPNSVQDVTFTFDVAEHAGAVLDLGAFEVAVHGANVSAGRINQQGGSTLTVPYLVPEEPDAAT